jgi:hypothetical protein
MRYLAEELGGFVGGGSRNSTMLAESKATVALRDVVREYGVASAASDITPDSEAKIAIALTDNLIRYVLPRLLMYSNVSGSLDSVKTRLREFAKIDTVDAANDANLVLRRAVLGYNENRDRASAKYYDMADTVMMALSALKSLLRADASGANIPRLVVLSTRLLEAYGAVAKIGDARGRATLRKAILASVQGTAVGGDDEAEDEGSGLDSISPQRPTTVDAPMNRMAAATNKGAMRVTKPAFGVDDDTVEF